MKDMFYRYCIVFIILLITACSNEDISAEIELLREQEAELTAQRDALVERVTALEQLMGAEINNDASSNQDAMTSEIPGTITEIPQLSIDEIDSREYSDDELQDMLSLPAEDLKEQINTVSDAVALLDMMFPVRFDGASMNWGGPGAISNDNQIGRYIFYSGEDVLHDRDKWINRAQPNNPVWYSYLGNIEAAMAYLLCDNYEVGVLYGLCIGGGEYLSPIAKTVNYIKVDGYYVIFRPLSESLPSADGPLIIERYYTLPETTTADLDAYISYISDELVELVVPLDNWLDRFEDFSISNMPNGWTWEADWDWFDYFDIPPTPLIIFDGIGGYPIPIMIELIFAIPGGQEFIVSNFDGKIEVVSPEVEPIFINPYYPYNDR